MVVRRGEVRSVDDEGLSVPSAPRVPQRLTESPGKMWVPVSWNDGRVVVRLHRQPDTSPRLHDLNVAVHGIAGIGGTYSRHARRDTADDVGEILRALWSGFPRQRGRPFLLRLGS